MILAALALAAAPAAGPEAAVTAIFAPYRQPATESGAAWDRPIFTPRLKALIAKWRAVTPSDEVDDLADFDWLCQCQDWDAPKFRARIIRNRPQGPGRRAVSVVLGGKHDRPEPVRFVLQQTDGAWLIDDIVASGFAKGLRAALIKTTAADIALRRKR